VSSSAEVLTAKTEGKPSTLAAIFSDLLAGESESIEIFRSRGVIRVTTLQYKRDVVVQAVEEAVKSIRREEIHLSDLYPASYSNKHKNRTLGRWIEKNFDDSVLLELSRITDTEIERLPDFKVRAPAEFCYFSDVVDSDILY